SDREAFDFVELADFDDRNPPTVLVCDEGDCVVVVQGDFVMTKAGSDMANRLIRGCVDHGHAALIFDRTVVSDPEIPPVMLQHDATRFYTGVDVSDYLPRRHVDHCDLI